MSEIPTEIMLAIGGSAELSILAKATSILVLALVALRMLRRVSASVRSVILASTFGTLMILPVAVVSMPPVALNVGSVAVQPEPQNLSAATASVRSEYPVAARTDRSAKSIANRTRVPVRLLLAMGWATGALLFMAPVIETLCRLRRMRGSSRQWLKRETLVRNLSREAGLRRHVDLLVHEDLAVPFTYGLVRPAIVMPGDAQEWTDAEVRRALVHELEHVRRGDWPVHVMARVVCSLYWFHPLVWIAWRHFCLESERACDDAVVRSAEGIGYAEQLVALARRLSRRAPAPVLSMANRGDLKARVAAILDENQARGRIGVLSGGVTVGLAVALAVCISPLKAMSDAGADAAIQAPEQHDTAPSFVQASVTPHTPGKPPGIPPLMNGRFTACGLTLKDLIRIAYGSAFPLLSYQIVGGPAWIDADRFDIDAQVPNDMTFGASWHPRVKAMLQTLVGERFGLQLSRETREFPFADLVLANTDRKLGAGLRPSAADCVDLFTSPSPPPEHYLERVCGLTQNGPGLLAGKKITMTQLAGVLSDEGKLNRVVRDRTGLDGAFDVHLEYTPDSPALSNASSAAATAPSPISPALLKALETQLGLRLEPKQGPVEVLVIRQAEKPKGN
jgi:uncharacterized protein (TIGR03435 family)